VTPKNKALRARLRLSAIGAAGLAAVALGVVSALTLGGHDSKPARRSAAPATSSSGTSSATPTHKSLTPATSKKIPLMKSTKVVDGIGVGFEHSALGVESAAVSYWQDLDILDDAIARRQWTQITSKDSPGTVDKQVSGVRKLREGSGLPPSGGTPAGLSFTTVVDAISSRSLDTTGDVVDVWIVYDRYATLPADKGGADNDPLKSQLTDLILKWEDGDWKVTEEPQYTGHKFHPVAYDPNSTFAWDDGWREVSQ
jgi:hypothetical protein